MNCCLRFTLSPLNLGLWSQGRARMKLENLSVQLGIAAA